MSHETTEPDMTSADTADIDDKAARKAARTAEKRRTRVRRGLIVVLIILLLLLVTTLLFAVRLMTPVGTPKAGDLSEGLEWVRSIYGWGKGEDQQLYGPTDVGIGPDGIIWVNDPQRFQIVGFNPDGSYRALLMKGPGYMMPQAFDISDDNEIYVADFDKQKIRVFTPDNEELRSWDSSLPVEVAVQGDRVVVGQRDRIALYDTDGTFITEWGTRGKAEDQVDIVRGIVFGPDGTIYASDTQNKRIKSFTQEGELNWVYPTRDQFEAWSEEASAGGQPDRPFQLPAGMTFDGAGRLVLVDPFEFTIIAIDPATGEVTDVYGDFGETDGKFGYPTSIDYDPLRDWFAVADTANNRVQILRLDGSGGGALSGVARLLVGPVWVCLVPLLLLVLALLVATLRRRAARRISEQDAGAGDTEPGLQTSDEPDDADFMKISSE